MPARPSLVATLSFVPAGLGLALALALPSPARAGGWDTPMLYSSRHMGMGGAAVSYVRDPSALFHNPAGLAHTRRLSLLGDFSLLLGGIQGSPSTAARSVESETTVAPFFLVGASFRPLASAPAADFLTIGAAVYPVASAGAEYHYERAGTATIDHTRILFLEVSPGIALNLPRYRQLSIGFGWRFTIVNLTRLRYPAGQDPDNLEPDISNTSLLSLDLGGVQPVGFRVGVQWQPIPELEVGVAYRHKTRTELDADGGIALGQAIETPSTSLTLPSRLTFGVRGNLGPFSAATDVEVGFNSQNTRADIVVGTEGGGELRVPNVFEWSDALTLRLGVEYRIGLGPLVEPVEPRPGERADPDAAQRHRITISPRLGFVFDARTSNRMYPSAFGTPPAPTVVLTAGAGLDVGGLSVNLAFAHRFGSTTITEQDLESADACPFCGVDGDYAIALTGLYLDVGYDFD